MAALTTPQTEVKCGTEIVQAVTAFAITTAITMSVVLPSKTKITLKGTTSGAGAFDFNTAGVITMEQEGLYQVTVSDGTTTLTNTIRAWKG